MAFFYILDITLKFGYQKSQETAFLTFFSKTFTTKKQIEKIIGTAETKSTTNRGFQLSTSTGPNSALQRPFGDFLHHYTKALLHVCKLHFTCWLFCSSLFLTIRVVRLPHP
jgi:hypothetical protein